MQKLQNFVDLIKANLASASCDGYGSCLVIAPSIGVAARR